VIYAAGGIIQHPGTHEIALVLQRSNQKWTLPKGKVEGSETYEAAAVREVYEETGCVTTPSFLLGHATYDSKGGKKKKGKKKTVYYFVMDFIEQHDDSKLAKDIEELRWVCIEEAYDMLTMKRDRKILDRFVYGWSGRYKF
jgi:8-oxo-dGTP pyrophosphatase MutT (NUDIX family)